MATTLDDVMSAVHNRRFRVIADVHLLLIKDGKVLLGQRANTGYGDGAYHPPAGYLEEGESVVEALIRQAREEIGVTIHLRDVSFAHVMHNSSEDGEIALFFAVTKWTGEPAVMQPDRCSELRWIPLLELPPDMIDYARVAIRHYLGGAAFSTYPALRSGGRS
jgi:ADP-ribose pyrophosphatase YjhB (NUDIX family)